MKTTHRISTAALLLAATVSFSPSAWSLGLGDATVQSYLDEPLKVSIDLISRQTDDLTSLTASLASAADYQLIGANRESISVPINFTVEDLEGDAYISATSSLPVNTPVLRLIVEVNWSSGRMLREYTLFLDPPTVRAPAPAPRPQEVDTTPASTAPPAQSVETQTPAPTGTAAAIRVPEEGEYGPVQSGETLWGIARDWSRQTGLDINRVMIAIQRENPQAFLNNNINLLKRGAILRMPSVTDVSGMSQASANQEVVTQTEEFTGFQSADTVASADTPLLSGDSAAPEYPMTEDPASESAGEAVAEDAQPADQTPADSASVQDGVATDEPTAADSAAELARDSLELVPPSEASELDSAYGFEEADESGDTVAVVQTLREDLARTEEELVSQQQQNEYLEDRIKELESTVASGPATVSDEDLAAMEERLRQERLAASRAAQRPVPWYANLTYWLIGLLILAAGVIGWLLTTRGKAVAAAVVPEQDESIAELKGEAEEVLQILEDPEDQPADDTAAGEDKADRAAETADATAEEVAEIDAGPPAKSFYAADDDAELLDEESSDPEIQLDLARAYISMGDKEAARIILEEVVSNGSDQQRSEAEKMLNLL